MFTSSHSIYLQLIVTLTLCSPQDTFTFRNLVFIFDKNPDIISGRRYLQWFALLSCLSRLSGTEELRTGNLQLKIDWNRKKSGPFSLPDISPYSNVQKAESQHNQKTLLSHYVTAYPPKSFSNRRKR